MICVVFVLVESVTSVLVFSLKNEVIGEAVDGLLVLSSFSKSCDVESVVTATRLAGFGGETKATGDGLVITFGEDTFDELSDCDVGNIDKVVTVARFGGFAGDFNNVVFAALG